MRCRLRFVVAGLLSFAAVAAAEGPATRPADPWVFRSVLDKHPRMITVALHENLWLAFDAQSCGWRKTWKGGVTFTGSVYDTKHGPQPQSKGEAYYSSSEPPLLLSKGEKPVEAQPVYRGYTVTGGRLTIRYDLLIDGTTVSVEESPEYAPAENELVRFVKVAGVAPGVVVQMANPSSTDEMVVTTSEQAGIAIDGPRKRWLTFKGDGEATIRIKLIGGEK
jgi:cytochrome c